MLSSRFNQRTQLGKRLRASEVTTQAVVPHGLTPAGMASGDGGGFIGPLNMSMAERRANGFGGGYRGYRKRRYTRKKTVTRKRRAPSRKGGFQVYKPAGLIAGVMGRGGYFSNAMGAMGRAARRMVPNGAFSRIGAAAGGVLGGGWGARLGGLAGEGISNIAGFGAYNVNVNSLMLPEGTQIPAFGDLSQATIVRHREFIGDITVPGTPATFTNVSYPLNPGMSNTFPWLSTLASAYDQYVFLGMIFEFKSTFSENATTTGPMGSVIMSTEYDSADASFTTKLQMENNQYTVSNKPSMDMVHIIECDPTVTHSPLKYLRNQGVPSGKDVRLYDHGVFQIATVGLPTGSTGNVGELWCSYEVALIKPQLGPGFSGADHFVLATSINSPSTYLGTNTVATYSGIGGTTSGNTYSFPAGVIGSFGAFYVVVGASTALTTGMLFTLSNASNLNILDGQTNRVAAVTANATATRQIIQIFFSISQAQSNTGIASFALTTGTLPGTISSADLVVYQLPTSIV